MATFTAIGSAAETIVIQYKGFKIGGSSIPMIMAGWESLGTVYRNGRTGSMIEVARIEGKLFETMKEAEHHGLELAREWVDRRWLGL
jgi:hypothetical protein